MDLSRLSDAELQAMMDAPDPQADMPAAGAAPVAQRVMPNVRDMSDAQLLALQSAPEPKKPGVLSTMVSGLTQGTSMGFADEWDGVVGGGIPGLFNGEGFKAGYERMRDKSRAYDKAAEEAHPWVHGGSKIAGNVLGTAPIALSAPGAMGLTAATLPGRIGTGAASGLILGGIQGTGEGEGGAKEQGLSALVGGAGGAVFGGAAPIAGSLIGKAAAPIIQRWKNRSAPVAGVNNAGADMLAEDFTLAGGRQAIDARMAELGPDARLYHAGPTFEGSAQGLRTRPETREIITNDVRGLREGAVDRLNTEVDAALGPAPVPSQVRGAYDAWQERLGPRYAVEEARARPLTASEGGDLWDLADGLAATQKGTGRSLLDQAANALAPEVRSGGRTVRMPDTSPEGLMASRRVLDGLIARVEESAQLQREGVGMKLQQIRQAIDDQVRAINPELKNVDRGYEAAARGKEAFDRGLGYLDRDAHPADVRARFDAAPMEEQAGERLGARARVDREMGNTNRDLVKLRDTVKTEGKWANDKLGTYFGRENVDAVERAVNREATFEETARRIVDNSMTADRTASAARFAPRGEKASDLVMPIASTGGPTSMALAAAVKMFKGANTEADKLVDVGRNKDIGRILTMMSGPELDATLDAIGRRAGLAGKGEAINDNVKRMAEILMRANGNEAAQAGRKAMGR